MKTAILKSFQDKSLPVAQQSVVTTDRLPVLFKKKWVYHSLFWILYYLFICAAFYTAYNFHDISFYIQISAFMPVSAALAYINIYVLIPAFLYRRKYFYYALSLILALFVMAYTDQLIKILYIHLGYKIYTYTSGLGFKSLFSEAVGLFYLAGFTTGIKLSKDWLQNQQLMKEKEKQYLETELNFLKTQIHPHFFFNTLNNLYSLTLKKSDQAPQVVLKLSGLMSYMLYESNATLVSLNKEITYLQNYLDLEKLRFGQRLYVSFEIEGEIDAVSIPPMILILFVENSFKHGIKNNINKIAIEITLKVEGAFLFFSIKNPIGENLLKENTGIGLKNAKRRLELLYGKNYQLDISEKDNEFNVSLKMPAR
ncbi:MAG TPA: histidine kinase [Puia sp.]|jgi:two-component system LytT family sensor kinase|nr:histidine kinase [Puia sp.]